MCRRFASRIGKGIHENIVKHVRTHTFALDTAWVAKVSSRAYEGGFGLEPSSSTWYRNRLRLTRLPNHANTGTTVALTGWPCTASGPGDFTTTDQQYRTGFTGMDRRVYAAVDARRSGRGAK